MTKRKALKLGMLSLLALSSVSLASCDFTNNPSTSDVVSNYCTLELICTSADGNVNTKATVSVKSGEVWTPLNPSVDGYKFEGWYFDEEFTLPIGENYAPIAGGRLYGKMVKVEVIDKDDADSKDDSTNDNTDNSSKDNTNDTTKDDTTTDDTDNKNNSTDATDDKTEDDKNNALEQRRQELLAQLKTDFIRYTVFNENENKLVTGSINQVEYNLLTYNSSSKISSGVWVENYTAVVNNGTKTYAKFISPTKAYMIENNGTTSKKYYTEDALSIYNSFVENVNSDYTNIDSLYDYFAFEDTSTVRSYKASVSYKMVDNNYVVDDSEDAITLTVEYNDGDFKVFNSENESEFTYSIPKTVNNNFDASDYVSEYRFQIENDIDKFCYIKRNKNTVISRGSSTTPFYAFDYIRQILIDKDYYHEENMEFYEYYDYKTPSKAYYESIEEEFDYALTRSYTEKEFADSITKLNATIQKDLSNIIDNLDNCVYKKGEGDVKYTVTYNKKTLYVYADKVVYDGMTYESPTNYKITFDESYYDGRML